MSHCVIVLCYVGVGRGRGERVGRVAAGGAADTTQRDARPAAHSLQSHRQTHTGILHPSVLCPKK